MAEPLSLAASIIAVLGAAEKTGRGLERLRSLHNASDEIEYILNEVYLPSSRPHLHQANMSQINDMRVVLRSVHNAEMALTGSEAEDIHELVQRCRNEVLELDTLVTYHLQAASGYDSAGRAKVNTRGWLSKSGQLGRIRERLRDRRENLAVALLGSMFAIL